MQEYLGVDEDIDFDRPLNKVKINKEFLRKARKIWESELYSRNKVTAYNAFALPVLTMSVGVLDWNEHTMASFYLNCPGKCQKAIILRFF